MSSVKDNEMCSTYLRIYEILHSLGCVMTHVATLLVEVDGCYTTTVLETSPLGIPFEQARISIALHSLSFCDP